MVGSRFSRFRRQGDPDHHRIHNHQAAQTGKRALTVWELLSSKHRIHKRLSVQEQWGRFHLTQRRSIRIDIPVRRGHCRFDKLHGAGQP
jgi:hypothetical protein